jgi:putative DNA primase/helicase
MSGVTFTAALTSESRTKAGATEADVVGTALKGRRNGRDWLCRCPAHDDKTPSLSVGTGRDGRLLLTCFAGCAFGDVRAALVRDGILEGRDQSKRHGAVTKRSAPIELPPDPQAEADLHRRVDAAYNIFQGSGPIRGTLGEHYLVHHRKMTVTTDPAADFYLLERLRFHRACPFGRDKAPAIIAPVTGPKGYIRGVWRIRLDSFGQKVGRFGLGDCRGGAARLVDAYAEPLAVAEGVEDALAWMQLTGSPAWAALSTSGMAGLVLPTHFRDVTVIADGDAPGIKAAKALGRRLQAEGRNVQVKRPPAGLKDANACLEARP